MLVRLALRGRRGCMARPRLTSLARHYSEAAAAVATEPQEEHTLPGKPTKYWHRDLTLMQHVLGIHPDKKLPPELSRASRLADSTMLDVLIVAFDLEAKMANHTWSRTKRGGAVIGVSILDTRHIRRELSSEAAPGSLGLDKAFRPLQFHVLSDRPECRSYISRQAPKFTFGTSMELQAEDVSPTLRKLLTGRDVITVFHHASNDKMLLKNFGVEAFKQQLLEVDTYNLAVALEIQSSLEWLSQVLFIDIDFAHIAGNDALATLKVLCHLVTLLPDPRFGTHNDHGALLRSRLFADVADHPWLAGQISSIVGKMHGKQSDVMELALGHLEGFIHAYRSRGQQFSWLEHRHWAARVNFANWQIRQQDESPGLEHRQIQRAGYLQQLPQLPEPLEPLDPPSADPSRQPLSPTPPPEVAETSHINGSQVTADTLLSQDIEISDMARKDIVKEFKQLIKLIDRAFNFQSRLHDDCLSHLLHPLQHSWSLRRSEMQQWEDSTHRVNRRFANELFVLQKDRKVQAKLHRLTHHLKGSAADPSQSFACYKCSRLIHGSEESSKQAESRSPSPLPPLQPPSGEHQSSVVEEPRCEDPISQELESNWMV